jgi:hypothetical protein
MERFNEVRRGYAEHRELRRKLKDDDFDLV